MNEAGTRSLAELGDAEVQAAVHELYELMSRMETGALLHLAAVTPIYEQVEALYTEAMVECDRRGLEY